MRRIAAVWILLFVVGPLPAQPEFPPLSGRVVDRAELLDPAIEERLSRRLAAHEQSTSQQVVVVTIPSLQGYDIADYGYQLGRHWGIGQKGEDNGALLIVARDDRKVRIEVGYGLEGRLTDALSHLIINQIMLPEFRQGEFETGIARGTDAILQALGSPAGQGEEAVRDAAAERGGAGSVLFFVLFFFVMLLSRGGRFFLGGALLGSALGHGRGGGGLGGGLGGGGFGGGGGSFGGGGASGGW